MWTWLRKNPQVGDQVQQQVQRLSKAKGRSPEAMRATLQALHDQIAYLMESADDQRELDRAGAWSASIVKLEHAVDVAAVGGSRAELKRLRTRIDDVRKDILDAFLVEKVEDAGGPAPLDPVDRS